MLSPTQQYQLSDSQKSMAYTINQYGQKTGAFYWCGGKNSLYEAKRCAINNCIKFYGKQGYCITGLENNNDVFNKRVSDYLKQQQRNSIAAKKNLCKSYGFKSENAIASCVQREIERERLAIAQRNANIARQNAQRQENINRALSEAAKTIQNIGTPNSNVSVCNFKCVSSGVIVAGDCSRGAVYIGSETCFKTN
tara:strand:- start:34 stop:618 length:585 start_codon:yes stop_codon:yes gene_type:complete